MSGFMMIVAIRRHPSNNICMRAAACNHSSHSDFCKICFLMLVQFLNSAKASSETVNVAYV